MASPIFLNDVLVTECVEYYANLQQISVQRRYWQFTVQLTVGPIMFGDVATAIDSAVSARLKACMANNANYQGTRCRRVKPVGTDQWEYALTRAGPGTAGAVAAPAQVAGLTTLLSATIGKKGEGRIYIPFPAAADVAGDGACSAGYITAATAFGNQFAVQQTVAAAVGAGTGVLQPVLFTPGSVALPINITDSRQLGVFATQKRRGAYGRFNRPPF